MSRPPLGLAVLLVLACKRSEAPTSATAPSAPPATPTTAAESTPAPAAQAANPNEKAWKVKPTPLSVIKADPPTYLGTPTLVFVAVKPTAYFNYGYNNARNSHFAFEMRPAEKNGRLGAPKLYGYAARSWARPFFEEVNKRLEVSGKEYAPATLVVAYSKKRYDGQSADHIEILAADVGEKLDMDPAAVVAPPRTPSASRAATNSGSDGDCAYWRQLRRAGQLELPVPQFCRTYPLGAANRLAKLGAQNGFSRAAQVCTAWRVENRLVLRDQTDGSLNIVAQSCLVDEQAGQVHEGEFPE